MSVQCKGAEEHAASKETVESLNRLTSHVGISRCRDQRTEGTFLVTDQSHELHQNTILRQLAWWRTPSNKKEKVANPGDCDT